MTWYYFILKSPCTIYHSSKTRGFKDGPWMLPNRNLSAWTDTALSKELQEPLGLRYCHLLWSSSKLSIKLNQSFLKVNSIVSNYHLMLKFHYFQKPCLMDLLWQNWISLRWIFFHIFITFDIQNIFLYWKHRQISPGLNCEQTVTALTRSQVIKLIKDCDTSFAHSLHFICSYLCQNKVRRMCLSAEQSHPWKIPLPNSTPVANLQFGIKLPQL